jgi:hypothetical protein
MGPNACTSSDKKRDVTIEESYIHFKQKELMLPISYTQITTLIKENSNRGKLTAYDLLSILNQIGAIKEKTVEDASRQSKKWYKFFSLFSNKDSKTQFESLNLIIAFALITSGDLKGKLEEMFDSIDLKLRGYVNREQVYHIVNTLIVTIVCYIPCYCSDYPYDKKKFLEMYNRWKKYSVEICGDISDLISATMPVIKKKDFIERIVSSYGMLFDPTELRAYVNKESKKKDMDALKDATPPSIGWQSKSRNSNAFNGSPLLQRTSTSLRKNTHDENLSFRLYTPINSTPVMPRTLKSSSKIQTLDNKF